MTHTQTPVVLVMAGGTGGHIFPALAVADVLKRHGAQIHWLGTHKGMEARLIPEYHYPIHFIEIDGLRGKGIKTLITMPFKLLKALWQTFGVYRKIKPNVVLGMGGFVTGPGGLMAWMLAKPLVVHEQNAIAGLTNKLLYRLAKKVFAAFPGAFKAAPKLTVCGNPVRQEIVAIEAPETRLQQHWQQYPGQLNILVVGGSLGAMALNKTIPQALELIVQKQMLTQSDFTSIKVKHQCGEKHQSETEQAYQLLSGPVNKNIDYEVMPFIKNMAETYAWADVIICRSGALTVSEIAAAGIASILVPFPYAVDDHQTANGAYLADQDAAVLIQQRDLDKQKLAQLLADLSREKITAMSVQARKLSITDAAEVVAQECLSLAG